MQSVRGNEMFRSQHGDYSIMTEDYIVQIKGVSKSFGAVEAVKKVDLELRRGEILGVVGDNGAGKSTLMKLLSGILLPDEGEIYFEGEKVDIKNPQDARTLGIEMIYQDLALFNNLSVADNVFVGRERTKHILGLQFLDKRRMNSDTEVLLGRLGIIINSVKAYAQNLSGGQRQMVAIARAVAFEANTKILIMDEPHAALGVAEANTVSELIRGLHKHGLSVIVISHRIPELLTVVDRVMVLKRGERVAIREASKTTVEECVNLIVTGGNGSRNATLQAQPEL
jgi:simple sugar transport system ATP-binding protein